CALPANHRKFTATTPPTPFSTSAAPPTIWRARITRGSARSRFSKSGCERGDTMMRFDLRVAAALALGLVWAAPALADGGNSGGNKTTCPPGEVYDARSMQCVKQKSGILPDKELAQYAYALAKAERYAEAILVLALM